MTYTQASMDALRTEGDELADATVATLFERGEVGKFNTLMRYVSTAGQDLPEGLPDVAREYLNATSTPPAWVDWGEMEKARLFFIDNNVHISTALSFASMPACYVLPHVAKLLSSTHSLKYPSKRMAETGQFTVYLMQPGAFEAGSRFIPAAQKVRLLHASIRHHLKREDRWDTAALGTPICQEDMIGGQMMFSIQVLDALHRLGIHMSNEGAEAYYYAWRVVGAILGIDQGHVPQNLQAAREFSDLYMTRHMGPSEEGAQLTRQLIDLYEEVVPGTFFDPIVSALIRYLIGDTCADWLQVPRTTWDTVVKAAPTLLGLLETIEDRSPLAGWALDRLGHLTSAFELSSLTRGRVMHYAIPEHLKKDFGVSSTIPPKSRWTPPSATVSQ
ncbi:oxygenase MpaB family protein [Streptomyces europaeiscabiei]|uniref:Oxygenase MpaB family protein n=1 Tax=Streptomyces europaeiscabiei TaxID=146819 RepID=A0ABU4NYF9_9ACTN|nr:oxygenase MpaB family protein [Streptomyces europaeiscabiei]MDX2765830.1 oxygenase MpaB family protein [Streptomyces europaeiscabiei]MDX3549691.1 oxygenase MpaB family protein [Streptomyces europaeiscabiei]MDX3558978.1 oxygenase MpaB family protein [Streptomyces europaeiscabiei]MDX3672245.1 oxygenase MpaB family protein [Streptomyces europaeiscabiei]MDX3706982.1 oxygenase MpaB family protein [Streptomyces europaeiscabiei]